MCYMYCGIPKKKAPVTMSNSEKLMPIALAIIEFLNIRSIFGHSEDTFKLDSTVLDRHCQGAMKVL